MASSLEYAGAARNDVSRIVRANVLNIFD